jgi:hypothetical protein
MTWRVGERVPVNVYDDDDRPVCQCHTALDAKLIVKAVNFWNAMTPTVGGEGGDDKSGHK